VLLASIDYAGPLRALHSMGYFPPGLGETAKCMALTCLLFLGPLFETGIAEGDWRDWLRLRGLGAFFSSWVGSRNIVAVGLCFCVPRLFY
jgi:prenyl protein peptidase